MPDRLQPTGIESLSEAPRRARPVVEFVVTIGVRRSPPVECGARDLNVGGCRGDGFDALHHNDQRATTAESQPSVRVRALHVEASPVGCGVGELRGTGRRRHPPYCGEVTALSTRDISSEDFGKWQRASCESLRSLVVG